MSSLVRSIQKRIWARTGKTKHDHDGKQRLHCQSPGVCLAFDC